MNGVKIIRTDIRLKNKRGLHLECSHFEPQRRPCKKLPCVIYLHGNSSSRMEAIGAVSHLLPMNITLFCFDFAGCGHSEGDYISLGWYEKDDVEVVIDHLRKTDMISTVGLWGRSMGAATAIMHAERDFSIGGLALDSPFSSMKILLWEIAKKNSKMPKFILSVV